MNHAARVAVAAHGGQILLHESSWNKMLSYRDDDKESVAMFRNMGKHTLKGISRSVYIIQVRALHLLAATIVLGGRGRVAGLSRRAFARKADRARAAWNIEDWGQ
jgi:hypothetical protein